MVVVVGAGVVVVVVVVGAGVVVVVVVVGAGVVAGRGVVGLLVGRGFGRRLLDQGQEGHHLVSIFKRSAPANWEVKRCAILSPVDIANGNLFGAEDVSTIKHKQYQNSSRFLHSNDNM